jgi:hypothetical protein
MPVGRRASSSLSRSESRKSRPGQRSSGAIVVSRDRWTNVTRSPRVAARMPSTICAAGIALEMKPRAPARTSEFASAASSEKLKTMMAPFAGSEASSSTRARIEFASPYVSKSVTSTVRSGVVLTSSSTTVMPGA